MYPHSWLEKGLKSKKTLTKSMETWILSCNVYDWNGWLFTFFKLKMCILLCLPAAKAEVHCVKEEVAALAQQSPPVHGPPAMRGSWASGSPPEVSVTE